MADLPPTSPVKPAPAETADNRPQIKPLTRRGYKRLEATEKQIAEVSALDAKALLARAQHRDETAPDYLSPEALVYLIRRADRGGNTKVRDALLQELLERCALLLRGRFSGFDEATRQDLQQDVLMKVVEDVLAPDDRADFMEARFGLYLKRRRIDARRSALKDSGKAESLDVSYSGEDESEGWTKLDSLADTRLSPEELTTVSEGLAKLPPRLREVFLLRHAVGMEIGSDNPADDPPDKLTLAQRFGCSGRTIRNWLNKADDLLADFREKKDDKAK